MQEKRRDEEFSGLMNEWGRARSRIETEIQRKKESNYASNFEKARGFVRTDFKSIGFVPGEDPTVFDSSSEES